MAEKSYGYFDHEADAGIMGRGASLEAAFEAAAEATFALMAEPSSVRPVRRVSVEFEEPDRELALVTWLNGLLAQARAEGLALGRFHLRRRDGRWLGEGWGEAWRPGLERGVEVKGATLTMLEVGMVGGSWQARCVVDV